MITTFMFLMIEMMLILLATPILFVIAPREQDSLTDILMIFPMFFATIVMTVLFCCALNLVTLPFTKYAVTLDRDFVTVRDKKVKYADVTRIEIDSGTIRRFGGSDPCGLDLYSYDELLVSITHPSLIMSFLLILRCNNAYIKYVHLKRVVFLFLFAVLMFAVLGIYSRCGGIL